MTTSRLFVFLAAASFAVFAMAAQAPPPPAGQPPAGQPPAGQPPQPGQGEVVITITGGLGLPPKLAVPDFIPLTSDAETIAAAKTIGQVLWDDLEFEREFYLIARDTYRTIPQATSVDDVPLDRWKELNADGLVIGTVRKTAGGVAVQYRLIEVHSGRSALAKEYTGSPKSIQPAEARVYAHTIADEIHQQQRGLDGVARTKLAFTSDRDGERIRGPVADRGISNLYIADYDGARQQRLTITRSSDISPVWSPDNRSLVFSSWRSGYQDIYVLFPYDLRRRMENPTRGTPQNQNYLPAWSPDGAKIAFTSSRDGNAEIYTMNRDGSGVLRITNHPRIDSTPTWSPTGTQLAFTSDRSGVPQIYVVNADGTGLRQISSGYSDRPTWSPAPWNEIAYASRTGPGNDIRVFDFSTGSTRTITDGVGNNESPAFAPNGRHLAFVSSRAGKEQIFTIARDGRDLRQITRVGVNRFPNWSAPPRRD